MIGPSVTEGDVYQSLKGFLATILPPGIPILRTQINRVASPAGDFVMMTPLLRTRLATNIDATIDIAMTGQIDGPTLTVDSITGGALAIGSMLFGTATQPLAANTRVTAFDTGTGGAGTYTVSPEQTFASDHLYAGVTTSIAPTQLTVQIDIYGEHSADYAQIITTLLRDEFGTHYFDGLGLPIQTLYANDARQMVFLDAETQFEHRWIVEAVLQANIEVDSPMQFADEVVVTIPPGVDLPFLIELP